VHFSKNDFKWISNGFQRMIPNIKEEGGLYRENF
jgi:hypothetical protein